jgi:hypothetical protein
MGIARIRFVTGVHAFSGRLEGFRLNPEEIMAPDVKNAEKVRHWRILLDD